MKPAQKLLLGCRQTGEAAGRIGAWLDHNRHLVGVGYVSIREDIDELTGQLLPLVRACESVPTIGLLGAYGACKSDLVFAMIGTRTPATLAEFGARAMDMGMLHSILPGDAGSSAVVRFSCSEPTATPRGQPIRIGLLALVDLAIILSSVAYTLALCDDTLPSARSVEALFDGLADHLSPQAQPGLSERDVQGLRDALMSRWPDHPMLRALSAAKFWDHFRDVAPHLAERERRQALAMLWGGHAEVTVLFQRLCEGLDKLAHGTDAYCGPDALVGKDTASGWMTRHPRSILDGATVLALEGGSGHPLSVVNRFGQTVELDRAVVAALLAELPLHLSGSRLSELAPADVLDFPVVMPISDRHLPALQTQISGAHGAADLNIRAQIIAHYLHIKTVYLFDRACLNHEVTSLVVIADPSRDDDIYSGTIADWVASAQGASAHAREKVRRGLFMAVAEHLVARPDGAKTWDGLANSVAPQEHGDLAAVQRLLRDVIGAGQDWPTMWTPNRPLSEIVVFPTPLSAAPLRPETGAQPAFNGLRREDTRVQPDVAFEVGQRGADMNRAPAPASPGSTFENRGSLVVNGYVSGSLTEIAQQRHGIPAVAEGVVRSVLDLSELIKALVVASDERQKHQQLAQRLQEIRRRMRHTLMRYHASNDPPAIAEWRRGTAIVVQDRVQLLSEYGRLGHLQRALLPNEADLITAMLAATPRQHDASSATGGRWSAGAPSIPGYLDGSAARGDINSSLTAQRCELAVSTWITGIRRAGRARQLCRDLRIQDSVFQHLIDELQIGATRIGLASEIGMAFQRANDLNAATLAARNGRGDHTEHSGDTLDANVHSKLDHNDVIRLAAYASRLITAYLVTLDSVTLRASVASHRGGAADNGVAKNAKSVATAHAPAKRLRPTATRTKSSATPQWETQFVNLVESNIASAHLLVGRGEKDRELGELLQLFASGPFEVET
jgi:hypothetical protein